MTLLTRKGQGPSIPYAGQPMHVLAGDDRGPLGFAAMELAVPAGFPGPVPHAHDEFDEAIYVLRGRLEVFGDGPPEELTDGDMFVAPRGDRHGFRNPFDEDALVLGIWAPAGPAMAFMREIGAALAPGTPPDPEAMRDIYHRHASRLLPLAGPTQGAFGSEQARALRGRASLAHAAQPCAASSPVQPAALCSQQPCAASSPVQPAALCSHVAMGRPPDADADVTRRAACPVSSLWAGTRP